RTLLALHSFPTRRSSDLSRPSPGALGKRPITEEDAEQAGADQLKVVLLLEKGWNPLLRGSAPSDLAQPASHFEPVEADRGRQRTDRKSTRLNSSHVSISY